MLAFALASVVCALASVGADDVCALASLGADDACAPASVGADDAALLQIRSGRAADAPGALTSCFGVRQQHLETLGDLARNVSTPSNPSYGQFWTTRAIDELLAPAPADVQVVTEWLSGLHVAYAVHSDLVCVTSGQDVRELDMPDHVAAVTVAIYSRSDPVHEAPPSLRSDDDVAETITPAVISERYSTGNATVHRGGKNSQMVFSQGSFTPTIATKHFFQTLPQAHFYHVGDEERFAFEAAGNSRAPPAALNCTGDSPSEWCIGLGEPTLDVQCMMGTAPGVQTRFFRLNTPLDVKNMTPLTYFAPGCLTLLNFVEHLFRSGDAPYSASVSYSIGCDEAQVRDMEHRLAKLALKGVSVLAASGDSGAGGLKTTWPAASPWVTAVGGTMLENGVEVAWNSSGGGFSAHPGSDRRDAVAPWQAAAVDEYLAKLPGLPAAPPAANFNRHGVGVPDVAAFGSGTVTCGPADGACGTGEGTSYSSPTFAGVVALLNEARLEAGMPPMGCLNPFLYQHREAFQDITVGNNKDSGSYGFEAIAGWDAVTGLGTPNFEMLRARALARGKPHAAA